MLSPLLHTSPPSVNKSNILQVAGVLQVLKSKHFIGAHFHLSFRIERCFYQISLKIKESSWENILQINVDLKDETTWFLFV